MRVLAIDPGYERLGIAIMEKVGKKDTLVHSECFQTPKTDAHPDRLCAIMLRLEEIILKHEPDTCAIETLFFAKNQTTALKVAEVRGIVLALCKKAGMDVREFSPAAIKMGVTGYGKSDKTAVTKMIPLLVTIDKKIKHDDEFDAIAIGITCLNSRLG